MVPAGRVVRVSDAGWVRYDDVMCKKHRQRGADLGSKTEGCGWCEGKFPLREHSTSKRVYRNDLIQ